MTALIDCCAASEFSPPRPSWLALAVALALGACATPGDFDNVPLCSPVTKELQVSSGWRWFGISTKVREADGKFLCDRALAPATPASGVAK